MEPGGTLPCSKQPATAPCPELDKSNQTHKRVFPKIYFNIMLPPTTRSSKWSGIVKKYRLYLPFKAQWELYVPAALTISNWAFCIYVFRMILTVNSDYFLKQR
jgi:hypothetical protein